MRQRVRVSQHIRLDCKQTREDGRPSRRAERLGPRVREDHALFGKSIEIGSGGGAPIDRTVAGMIETCRPVLLCKIVDQSGIHIGRHVHADIIHDDEQNIGSAILWRRISSLSRSEC